MTSKDKKTPLELEILGGFVVASESFIGKPTEDTSETRWEGELDLSDRASARNSKTRLTSQH